MQGTSHDSTSGRRGLLIAVEGGDGAGKATLTRQLVEDLRKVGRDAFRQDFPSYSSPTGALLQAHLRGEWTVQPIMDRHLLARVGGDNIEDARCYADMLVRQCLMTVNRYELAEDIERLLALGTDVVLDRYYGSSLAYGAAEGLDEGWIARISARLPRPDMWVLLDVPPEVAARRRERPRDLNEADLAKQEKVRQHYLTLFLGDRAERWLSKWRTNPNDGYALTNPQGSVFLCPSVTVDGERPPEWVADTVWNLIWYTLRERFPGPTRPR